MTGPVCLYLYSVTLHRSSTTLLLPSFVTGASVFIQHRRSSRPYAAVTRRHVLAVWLRSATCSSLYHAAGLGSRTRPLPYVCRCGVTYRDCIGWTPYRLRATGGRSIGPSRGLDLEFLLLLLSFPSVLFLSNIGLHAWPCHLLAVRLLGFGTARHQESQATLACA